MIKARENTSNVTLSITKDALHNTKLSCEMPIFFDKADRHIETETHYIYVWDDIFFHEQMCRDSFDLMQFLQHNSENHYAIIAISNHFDSQIRKYGEPKQNGLKTQTTVIVLDEVTQKAQRSPVNEVIDKLLV